MTFLPFSTIQINFTLFALNSQFLWPLIPIELIFRRRHKPLSPTFIPVQPYLLHYDVAVVDDIQPPSTTSDVESSRNSNVESSSLFGRSSTPTSTTCRLLIPNQPPRSEAAISVQFQKKLEVKSQFSTQNPKSDDAARQFQLGFIYMMQQDSLLQMEISTSIQDASVCSVKYYLKPALLKYSWQVEKRLIFCNFDLCFCSSDLISQTLLVSSC
ncbi:hypothetical protein Dsin_009549 [Dipteronia sinensis]|uniref:Uncharacterized protein n=1 Tax=Dipteronia sinensis TaxID=43782 RepID=A0AAE0AS32_9ROSI|nr:hypothetical protein Dsin_009549 [Dipteronia sinensis]